MDLSGEWDFGEVGGGGVGEWVEGQVWCGKITTFLELYFVKCMKFVFLK